MCTCTHTCMQIPCKEARRGWWAHGSWRYRGLLACMWVLGTELWSALRTAGVLSHGVLSPAPFLFLSPLPPSSLTLRSRLDQIPLPCRPVWRTVGVCCHTQFLLSSLSFWRQGLLFLRLALNSYTAGDDLELLILLTSSPRGWGCGHESLCLAPFPLHLSWPNPGILWILNSSRCRELRGQLQMREYINKLGNASCPLIIRLLLCLTQ